MIYMVLFQRGRGVSSHANIGLIYVTCVNCLSHSGERGWEYLLQIDDPFTTYLFVYRKKREPINDYNKVIKNL